MRVSFRHRRYPHELPRLMAHHKPVSILVGLLAVGVLLLSGVASAQEPATPESELDITPGVSLESVEPGTCLVGLAIETIHDINLIERTFDADFWIWSVCDDDRFAPLETMEFFNAESIDMSMYGVEEVYGSFWSTARITGTFRHAWDLSQFPFDEQVLQIVMEETAYISQDFLYEPDTADPIPVPEDHRTLDNWMVVETSLDASSKHYVTSYGDPRDPHGTSDYAQLVLSITVERTDLSGFIKLTFVVYIAFLISLLSYFLHMDRTSLLLARFSVVSATVFAVALSMNRVTSELGTEDGITLVDKIHIVALIAILVDAVAAMITNVQMGRGRSVEELSRFNRRVMVMVVIGFVTANVWLIGRAAIS